MAMLADPKRKQKFSVNPRGTTWSNDDSKFGQKLMEKMGWSKGKGLGAKLHGSTEHIGASLKTDKIGLGCSKSQADNWIAHQDDFNDLLASLNQGHGAEAASGAPEVKVSSLEQTSKTSKGRLHYQKFAKGKDLSSRSGTDLDCVFGKRKSQSGNITPQTQSEANSDNEDQQEKAGGLKTVTSTDSMQEYFRRKMAERKLKLQSGQAGGDSGSCLEEMGGTGADTAAQRSGEDKWGDTGNERPVFGLGFAPGTEDKGGDDKDDSGGMVQQCGDSVGKGDFIDIVEEDESQKKKKKKKKSKKRKLENEETEDVTVTVLKEETDNVSDKVTGNIDIDAESGKSKNKKRKNNKSAVEVDTDNKDLCENVVDDVECTPPKKKSKKKKSKLCEADDVEIGQSKDRNSGDPKDDENQSQCDVTADGLQSNLTALKGKKSRKRVSFMLDEEEVVSNKKKKHDENYSDAGTNNTQDNSEIIAETNAGEVTSPELGEMIEETKEDNSEPSVKKSQPVVGRKKKTRCKLSIGSVLKMVERKNFISGDIEGRSKTNGERKVEQKEKMPSKKKQLESRKSRRRSKQRNDTPRNSVEQKEKMPSKVKQLESRKSRRRSKQRNDTPRNSVEQKEKMPSKKEQTLESRKPRHRSKQRNDTPRNSVQHKGKMPSKKKQLESRKSWPKRNQRNDTPRNNSTQNKPPQNRIKQNRQRKRSKPQQSVTSLQSGFPGANLDSVSGYKGFFKPVPRVR